jgi:predicted RNase H-like HicB family nuclease
LHNILKAGGIEMKQRYLAIFEKARNNFGGFAPEVAGCGATARSLRQTRKLLSEGLSLHFQGLVEDGLAIPAPSQQMSYDFSEETPENGIEHCVVEWVEVEMPNASEPALSRPEMTEKSYA